MVKYIFIYTWNTFPNICKPRIVWWKVRYQYFFLFIVKEKKLLISHEIICKWTLENSRISRLRVRVRPLEFGSHNDNHFTVNTTKSTNQPSHQYKWSIPEHLGNVVKLCYSPQNQINGNYLSFTVKENQSFWLFETKMHST